jgi:hypothetical protein
VGQFVYVIRKRIKLSPEKAIFIFVKNVLPPTGVDVGELHEGKYGYEKVAHQPDGKQSTAAHDPDVCRQLALHCRAC